MKRVINQIFDAPSLRLVNLLSMRLYISYDPSSGRLDDGAGYTKVPCASLGVQKDGEIIPLFLYFYESLLQDNA